MRNIRLLLACLTMAGVARVACAQEVFESVGERALGMGGAFVAVADDSTATYWNPAGLVGGPGAGMTIGWHRFQIGKQDGPIETGPGRSSAKYTSVGSLPLGASYAHFLTSRITEDPVGNRQVTALRTTEFGVTILQSVASGLTVGSTVKYIRGGVGLASTGAATTGAALDAADQLHGDTQGRFDADLGVMVDMRPLRVGMTWRNLSSPSFGSTADSAWTLKRHARLGISLKAGSGLTLATDLDLDTVALQGGLRRMFAVGGEARVAPRLAFRSGVRWNLKGSRQPIGAVGVSVGIRPGLWVDSHYSLGRLDEDREFGASLRAGF